MDFFDGSPRERKILIGLGGTLGAVLILLLVSYLGGPSTSPASLDGDRDAALRDLQVVQSALANRSGSVAPAAREPFDRTRLIRGAQGASLALSRVEPLEDGGFTVTLEPAPSANVLRFLRELEQTTDASIIALQLEAAPIAPNVEARISFASGGVGR